MTHALFPSAGMEANRNWRGLEAYVATRSSGRGSYVGAAFGQPETPSLNATIERPEVHPRRGPASALGRVRSMQLPSVRMI